MFPDQTPEEWSSSMLLWDKAGITMWMTQKADIHAPNFI
jgi:hypothetical protein